MIRGSLSRPVSASRTMMRAAVTTSFAMTATSSAAAAATAPRSSVDSAVSSASVVLSSQRRTYVNAIFRKPTRSLMPTHTKEGEEIDVDKCLREIQGLVDALQVTTLVDHVFEMSSLPYADAMFPSDLVASYQDMFFPMPKYTVEHRGKEISDILRYMKSYGSAGDYSHILQDTPGARANGGDFVNIPSGLLVGYGKDRSTNEIAYEALVDTRVKVNEKMQKQAFPIYGIPLEKDAPPLGDFIGFAGQRTIFVRDTIHGEQAAKVITQTQTRVPWQVVKLEPEANFLTFHGGKPVNDVIVNIHDDESIERIGESGFNAYPIDWSEMKKTGITMRRLCLIARFALGSYSGGIRSHDQKMRGPKNAPSNSSAIYRNGERVYGDTGAPLEAQIRSKEVPQPVYQPPPRYRAPMHRCGLQEYNKEWADNKGAGSPYGHAPKDNVQRHYWETNSPYPKENSSVNTHPTMPATRTGIQPPDPFQTRRF